MNISMMLLTADGSDDDDERYDDDGDYHQLLFCVLSTLTHSCRISQQRSVNAQR